MLAALRRWSDRAILGMAAAIETQACVWSFWVLPLIPVVWPASLNVVQFVSSGVLQQTCDE